MKAVVIRSFGTPDVLQIEEVADPQPGPGEVRVAVHAVIVARTKDVAARSGSHPFSKMMQLPHILGAEHAGVVESVGKGVSESLVGTRVSVSAMLTCKTCRHCLADFEEACEQFELMGIHRSGAYADYTVVPLDNVWPLPDDVDFANGAAIAGNGAVAHAQLDAGQVGPDTTVLVLGAAGALGSTLVSLARFRKARAIAVDRGRQQDEMAALGAFGTVDSDSPDLVDQILDLTDGRGVDCVIDNLGLPSLWQRYQPAVGVRGRIVVSGSVSPEPIPLRLAPLYLKSQAIIGVRTGNRLHMDAVWEDVANGFSVAGGFVSPMPLVEVQAAHTAVETGGKRGQLVLTTVPMND